MEKKEYLKLREDLLEDSKDSDGVFSEEYFLSNILPDLQETKLIDSEDLTFAYLKTVHENVTIKNNASCINETGERLQLFIVDDKSTSWSTDEKDLLIREKRYYEDLFNQSIRFIKKSIKRHLDLLDSDPASFLVSQLGKSDFLHQIDVIEIFLVSASIPIESRSTNFSVKRLKFSDETIKAKITKNNDTSTKEILVLKKLIDLNYLYDLSISKGDKHPLVIDLEEVFNGKLEVLRAADEKNFESYLCVIPARGLADLYRRYSTRLLEKNVRSFLQFKGANKGMRDTISSTPERFIAYNNGLTITASKREIEEIDNKLYLKSLEDFQIVNGGQTTASIFFSQKQGLDISKIRLMAKINIAKNLDEEQLNELISNISLYSNSQSKVNNVDKKTSDPKIDKIKSLSNSVMTSNGDKWFFEKLRGEFRTMILLKGGNKKKVEKEYPKERRLTKTEIGKYYTAWGLQPWLVKKGGEKVFGYFLNHISGNGKKKDEIVIDRSFYEDLISKAILFRQLEIIHGSRKNAIGQLRSAVIPYSISVLYLIFGGTPKRPSKFNLGIIWRDQKLPDDLKVFMLRLMKEMYILIDKYKTSDDISENTKKEELWEKIKSSKEVKNILSSTQSTFLKKKYSRDVSDIENEPEVDFNNLFEMANLHYHGKSFFKKLEDRVANKEFDVRYLPNMFAKLYISLFPVNKKLEDLSESTIKYFKDLILSISVENSNIIEELDSERNELMIDTLNSVIKLYNDTNKVDDEILETFRVQSIIAERKKIKYVPGILMEIGKNLVLGKSPSINQIYVVSNFFTSKEKEENPSKDKIVENKSYIEEESINTVSEMDVSIDKEEKRGYLILLDLILEKGSAYWDSLFTFSQQNYYRFTDEEIRLIELGYNYFYKMQTYISYEELNDINKFILEVEKKIDTHEILNSTNKYSKKFPNFIKLHDWVVGKSIEDLIDIKTNIVNNNSRAKKKYLQALHHFNIDELNYDKMNLDNLRYLAWAIQHYSNKPKHVKNSIDKITEDARQSDYDSSNKLEGYIIKDSNKRIQNHMYIKRIVSQDIVRTPSVSVDAALKFFDYKGEPLTVYVKIKEKIFSFEIDKRNTRNEYRMFMKHLRSELKYSDDDFMIFSKKDGMYKIDVVKQTNKARSIYKRLQKLLGNNNHLVIKDKSVIE